MAGAGAAEDVVGAGSLAGGVPEDDGLAGLEVEFALVGLGGELALGDVIRGVEGCRGFIRPAAALWVGGLSLVGADLKKVGWGCVYLPILEW